ncbi:MAG: DegQ family serine endoprotease [Nitrospirae bacterium]|nr:DegQ family serine endoprotease [Nitrospirota bacterium]
MRIKKYLLLVILSSVLLIQFNMIAQASGISEESVNFLTKTGQAMAEVAEAVKPAIVNVSTTRTQKITENPFAPYLDDPMFRKFFGDRFENQKIPKERKTASLGSGVIVSSDGYILTNNHVVKDADEITVLLSDKKEFKGKVIGSDPKTDIAVVKIETKDLPHIAWGDSDKLKVGEIVLAIGNPFGLNQTVTMGIVSAVERVNMGIADYVDFIQTDAAINPGNSGGALVNAKGELVGLNTAIFSTSGGYQGIGFAIPSSMANMVMESLITKGKVIRGWLGVSIQPITPELASQFNLKSEEGSLVADVIEGGPAEKAGIMRGDVIIEFNGEKVSDPHGLRNAVAKTPPGEVVKIKVFREGEAKTLTLTIAELATEAPRKEGAVVNNALRGIMVQNITPEIRKQLSLPEKIRGVVISDIADGSPAETKLIPGDVIIEINKKATGSIADYEKIATQVKPEENVLLLVFRKGANRWETINGESPAGKE